MKNQKKLLSMFLIVIVLLSSIGAPKITYAQSSKVKISQTSAIVIEGDYLYLSMKGTKQKVTWTSSNGIASVTSNGKVSSNGTGKVTIIAKVAGKKYTCIVVFIPNLDPNYLTDRDVENALAQRNYIYNFANNGSKENSKGLPSEKTITTGESYTLKLDGIKGTAKWSSSNKSIVTVTAKGKIKGIKVGKAKITAAINNKKYTCVITVMESEEDIAAREKAEEEALEKRISDILKNDKASSSTNEKETERSKTLNNLYNSWISENTLRDKYNIYAAVFDNRIRFVNRETTENIYIMNNIPGELISQEILNIDSVRFQYIYEIEFEGEDNNAYFNQVFFNIEDLKAVGIIK